MSEDMRSVIVPKSDQINADDLQAGPMTITITDVRISVGSEQPVSISFEGSKKVYRPCKSMCRVMVKAWGSNVAAYKGNTLTLYCDPSVKWGAMEVGGIRISHMSHISGPMRMALTATKGRKSDYTVLPLELSVSPQTESRRLYKEYVALTSKEEAAKRIAKDGYSQSNPPTVEYLNGLIAEAKSQTVKPSPAEDDAPFDLEPEPQPTPPPSPAPQNTQPQPKPKPQNQPQPKPTTLF